jgi:hypothetical protein
VTAVPTTPPDDIIEAVKDEAQTQTVNAVVIFAGIAMIVISLIAVVAIRYVAKSVPAEFAGVVYNLAGGLMSMRQDLAKGLQEKAVESDATWDNPFADMVAKWTEDDWTRFADEAAAKGYVIQRPEGSVPPNLGPAKG